MFKMFVRNNDEGSSMSDFLSGIKANMLECSKSMGESESSVPLKEYLERNGEAHSTLHKQFTNWVSALTSKHPNWKFWCNFVLCDMLSYLTLFVSMRSGMWKLRLCGIKSMAPLFVVFDRPHYQKSIPNHLKDLAKMPSKVVSFF